MSPAFASTQKKEKKTVRLTCGVRAGRTVRSESSARTPANARARNRNLDYPHRWLCVSKFAAPLKSRNLLIHTELYYCKIVT